MKFIAIIPARYASTRFPGKPLARLGGKPVIERVYEQVAGVLDDAVVATDDERIRDAVAAYRPDNNRSQRRSTARNTLVVDCYNANPSSMQASLANFLGEESVGGKVAVLGDMLELGAWSAAEHRAAVEQALAGDVEQLWLVGTEFSAAWRAMGCGDERVRLFATCDEAAAALQASPFAGKFVLLKGSHGIGLERLIEWL